MHSVQGINGPVFINWMDPSLFLFPYHVLGKSYSANLAKALTQCLPRSPEVSTGSQTGNTVIFALEYSELIVRFQLYYILMTCENRKLSP